MKNRQEKKLKIRILNREKKINRYWDTLEKGSNTENTVRLSLTHLKGLMEICKEEKDWNLLSPNFQFLNPSFNWEKFGDVHIKNLIESKNEDNSLELGIILYINKIKNIKKENE